MQLEKIKETLRANLSSVIIISLGVLLVVGGIIFSLSHHKKTFEPVPGCKTHVEEYTVEDGSTDLFPVGTKLQVEMDYYKCRQGSDGDIVMIKTRNRPVPLIQTIRIAPGDKFKIEESRKKGLYNVSVNGDVMENSKGEKYAFSYNGIGMVRIYQDGFKNGVSKDVYFVFTDSAIGAGYDSTRFGPMMPESIVGKVLKNGEAKTVDEKPKEDAVIPSAETTEAPKEETAPEVKKELHKKKTIKSKQASPKKAHVKKQ